MGGIFIPDARGGLVWIHGSDGTAIPRKVLVDAAGHLQMDVLTVPVAAVTIADAVNGRVLIHGTNHAGNPVKLGVVHGYDAQYAEREEDLNGVAGWNSKGLAVVPVGEVWHILNVWLIDNDNVCDRQVRVSIGPDYHYLRMELGVAAGLPTIWGGDVMLAAGDRVVCTWLGVTLNDDLFWGAVGYKMKVV